MTQFSASTRLVIAQVEQGKINPDEMLGGFIKLSEAKVNFMPMLRDLGAAFPEIANTSGLMTIRIPAKNIGKISSAAIAYVDFQLPNSVGLKAPNTGDSPNTTNTNDSNKSGSTPFVWTPMKKVVAGALAIGAVLGILKLAKVI